MEVPGWHLLVVNVLLSTMSFSIVMPSLAPFLDALGASADSYVLAAVVAIYSVGEAIGSLALGSLSNVTRPLIAPAPAIRALLGGKSAK